MTPAPQSTHFQFAAIELRAYTILPHSADSAPLVRHSRRNQRRPHPLSTGGELHPVDLSPGLSQCEVCLAHTLTHEVHRSDS